MNICLKEDNVVDASLHQSWMSSSIPDNSVTSLIERKRKAPVHKDIFGRWGYTEVFIDIGQEIERPDDIVINWSGKGGQRNVECSSTGMLSIQSIGLLKIQPVQ